MLGLLHLLPTWAALIIFGVILDLCLHWAWIIPLRAERRKTEFYRKAWLRSEASAALYVRYFTETRAILRANSHQVDGWLERAMNRAMRDLQQRLHITAGDSDVES